MGNSAKRIFAPDHPPLPVPKAGPSPAGSSIVALRIVLGGFYP
jgi:hypothetical protein